MRELTDHIVSGDQAVQLKIEVTDEPGAGAACHRYEISGFDAAGNRSRLPDESYTDQFECVVLFQNGPIAEFGVNGITGEALLAIQIDRLRGFQSGPFASKYNEEALVHCELALRALQTRTLERIGRGVEGTNQK